jgi:TonB family protein
MYSRGVVVAQIVLSSAVATAAAQEVATLDAHTFIPVTPIERVNPNYPSGAQMNGQEGWVMLSFVVSAEGKVQEAMIEDSSGVESLERAALEAVSRWRYNPATENGRPVEQAMVSTRLTFQLEGVEKGAGAAFVSKYRQIARLLNEGKITEAQRLVEELELKGRRNLYEDAWFWWGKYVYLERSGSQDDEEKQKALQRALGYQEEYLTPDQFVAAAQRLVVLYARTLDLSSAISTFERLRDSPTARRADDHEKVVAALTPAYEQMRGIVAGDQALIMEGRVREHDYWVHNLLRRSFELSDVNGRLDALDIRCKSGTRRYNTIPDDVVWTVPPSWGECGVYVKGEPGTTFKFHEYPATYAAAAPVDVSQPAESP